MVCPVGGGIELSVRKTGSDEFYDLLEIIIPFDLFFNNISKNVKTLSFPKI